MPRTHDNSRFKVVLFDLDGTLVEFKFKVKESRVAMIEWLTNNGFDMKRATDQTRTQAIIDIAEKQSSSGTNSMDFQSVKEKLSNILDEFEFAGFNEARPHPGSLTLLKELGNRQIRSGVITNSWRKPVDSILGNFGFLPYLSLVITRNELNKLKPEPEGILKAIDLLGVSKDESIYVGDSVIDIQAALRAGIQSIGLAQGMYRADSLAKEGPDYLVENIEDVKKIVLSEDI